MINYIIYLIFFIFLSLFYLKIETFTNVKTHIFYGKIMNNNLSRQKGLSYRKTPLELTEGMLFKFDAPQIINITMENTLIPLTALILNHNMKVIEIIKNMKPQNSKIYKSTKKGTYFLEINPQNKQIRINDKVNFNTI